MNRMLKREVSDLDTVCSAIGIVCEIRDKKGAIDLEFGPVEEMHAMLARYEVRVAKEEADTVAELPYSWRKVRRQADEAVDQLAALHEVPRAAEDPGPEVAVRVLDLGIRESPHVERASLGPAPHRGERSAAPDP